MDTGKIYIDADGNECSINQMVKRDPFWAAERVQQGEVAIAENKRLRDAIQRALDDEETGTGWGPDVTVAGWLREALKDKL